MVLRAKIHKPNNNKVLRDFKSIKFMFPNGVDALKIQGRIGSMNFLASFSLSLENLCQKKNSTLNIKT